MSPRIGAVLKRMVPQPWKACRGDPSIDQRMRKSTALGIGKDIDLDLSHAARELLSQWSMRVVEPMQRLWILPLQILPFARRKSSMVTVMRTDHLDLIQLNQLVLGSRTALLRHHRAAHCYEQSARGNMYRTT